MLNTRRSNGFTVVELLVLLVVLVLLALVVLPALLNPIVVSSKIKCVNNLKNVGLSFRIFATDNEDRFPQEIMLSNGVARANIDAVRVFLTLSNELSTPKILLCPNDAKRRQAKAFTNMSGENVSYFASLTATEQLPQAFLAGDRNLLSNGVPVPPGLFPLSTNVQAGWSQEIHEGRGNICMGDGSVQQFDWAKRLKRGVSDHPSEVGTNWLAIP